MKSMSHHHEKGVALVVALFVLSAFSILLAVILADVEGELKMSGVERNSERALKLAETGVQVARATFMRDDMFKNLSTTMPIMQVDGFSQGGYFFTTLGSGFPGDEKWAHWHYDSQLTGNNIESEVSTPLMRVWATASKGRNGEWSPTSAIFSLTNIYSIVAEGTYFPIEKIVSGTLTTLLRAHDEYSGAQLVEGYKDQRTVWEGDKTVTESGTYSYAANKSPMASYTHIVGDAIEHQALYFTYAGEGATGSATSTTDTSSTVRLRAVNALCNPSSQAEAKTLWEFDTGRHGIGTAPTFFDPTPGSPGDEIIYFAMVELAGNGTTGTNLHSARDLREFTTNATDQAEQIYLYAIVDQTIPDSSDPCNTAADQRAVKWMRPYPDPDVANSTDYPTEHATGADGQNPPYIRKPSDMLYALPEDDLLPDYRDGTQGNPNCGSSDQCSAQDNQNNHVRGNIFTIAPPPSMSPPVLNVYYRLNNDRLTTDRKDTLNGAGPPGDPLIDIYLMYATYSQVKGSGAFPYPYGAGLSWADADGLKKKSTVQVRMLALRDRLDDGGTCQTDGTGCSWDWTSQKSLLPTFKWAYRLPAWDPLQTDTRPWNGYGEFVWDTWFDQQIAPMISVKAVDQEGTPWASTSSGQENLYTVLYPSYKSQGYVDEFGYNTSAENAIVPPTVAQGAPVAFTTTELWDDAHFLTIGIRDTWDDYMSGNQTNPLFSSITNSDANASKSNPVEPYWTNWQGRGDVVNSTYPTDTSETVIAFPNYTGTANSLGFARPYAWWESRWDAQIMSATAHPARNLSAQAWSGNTVSVANSGDIDVEGETNAFCEGCLNGDGLIVTVFNQDVAASNLAESLEDLRLHAINARTGAHIWDYHVPSSLNGDVYNATPAIANDRVFVAYQHASERKAILLVLDIDTGKLLQKITVDDKSDAVILPPAIANGAVYMGTYDFCDNKPPAGNCLTDKDMSDDWIRLFALSPMIRLLSVGIYPMSTTLSLESQAGKGKLMPRAERKLQVTISGGGSKWEESREVYQ